MIPSNSEINEKLFHLRRLHPNRVVEVCSNKPSLLKKKKSRMKLAGTSCSGLDSPGEVTPEQLLRMPHVGCCHPFFIYAWPMHQLFYLSTFRLELCDERIFMKYIYSVVRVIWLYWFSPRYLNRKVIYSYLFWGYKVLLVHLPLHQSTYSPRVALH